jgi:hypothetical protein
MRGALYRMVIILLVTTALRAQDIALMRDMLHYDEAYYGVDALSLLHAPRLTPFFPDNFGRESLWMYVLTPALAVFGATSFALRITALFVGVLTVAAVFRLGRVLFGGRVGVWSAAALAVLFWHVLASHQAFRALLYPLVGALAFAALWEVFSVGATRRVAPAAYIAATLFALLAYTYIAARAWITLAALVVAVAMLRAWWRGRTHGAGGHTGPPLRTFVMPIIVFGILIAPLAWTLLTNPALANLRGEQVAISSIGQLADNLRAWAGAWFVRGSEDVAYTLPGRPILDLPLALLLVGGVIAWGWRWMGRTQASGRNQGNGRTHGFAPTDNVGDGGAQCIAPLRTLFVIAVFAVALAPAVLTTDTLKPIRAVGVVVPLALLLGLAAAGIERAYMTSQRPAHRMLEHLAHAIQPHRTTLILLLALAAVNTSRDFAAWVRSPDLFLPMERHLMRGIDWLAAQDAVTPVYFSPFTPDHPVIRFRAGDLAPRSVSAFKADECLRLAEGGADYFALTYFDLGFADRLRPFATVSEIWREAIEPPRYTVFHAMPDMTLFTEMSVAWESRLSLVRVDGVPQRAAAGETINMTFVLIPSSPLPPLTMFVHLYGNPTPYEGGVLWAQADMPLCPGSPPATWRADEVIVQGAALTLPPDLPAGRYDLALGIYDALMYARLPVTTPDEGLDYVVVAEIEIGN